MTTKSVLVERLSDISIIKLNRPDQRNALNPELIHELEKTLEQLETDNAIKAVIVTGEGSAFCAGADLKYLNELRKFSDSENLKDSESLANLFKKLYSLPRLTIAMVNGPALAGGCGLAVCCDYIFAAEKEAKFGFTEARIGFIPAIVMNFLIRKIPLNEAKNLILTADIISAALARSIGLADKLFDSCTLKEQTIAYIENLLTQNSFNAIISSKKLYQELQELPLSRGIELSVRKNVESRKTEDCIKGLEFFIEKKKTNWRS